MNEPTQQHPVDHFAPILSQYQALEELIQEGTDPMTIRALLDGINEAFERKCDLLVAGDAP